MLAQVVATFLLTLDKYLLMDSVIVDLDNPKDSIPSSLDWTTDFDPLLLDEFMNLKNNQGLQWKRILGLANRKIITASTTVSPEYKRKIFLVEATVNASVADVTDAIWLEVGLCHNWNRDNCVDSKMLEYGGGNKAVIWNRAAVPSGLVSPRDFVAYYVRVDCVVPDGDDEHGRHWKSGRHLATGSLLAGSKSPPNSTGDVGVFNDDCFHRGPNVILYTNASMGRLDYDPGDDFVRGILGTSGFAIESISVSPPVTSCKWIGNGDLIKPSLLPEMVFTRVTASVMVQSVQNMKDFVESSKT